MPKYTLTKRKKIVQLKPKPMKENRLQKACVRWFDLQYPKLRQMLFHIPNGGSRNIIEASQFKLMGVRAGVPDLFLTIPNQQFHGLYIEMKSIGGEQSVTQKTFQQAVTKLGYQYSLCNDVDQFVFLVQKYLSTTPFFHPVWKQLAAPMVTNR